MVQMEDEKPLLCVVVNLKSQEDRTDQIPERESGRVSGIQRMMGWLKSMEKRMRTQCRTHGGGKKNQTLLTRLDSEDQKEGTPNTVVFFF